MRAVGSDLRLAARNLARRPGFTATAIATLALGVGANSLDFTWAKAIVLRPLPGVERRIGRVVRVVRSPVFAPSGVVPPVVWHSPQATVTASPARDATGHEVSENWYCVFGAAWQFVQYPVVVL